MAVLIIVAAGAAIGTGIYKFWLRKKEKEIEELRDALISRRPDNTAGLITLGNPIDLGAVHVIAIYGYSGVGKTSLINSLMYAVNGDFRTALWFKASDLDKPETTIHFRTRAQLTDHIVLVENRGFAAPELVDLSTGELKSEVVAQLNGERGYDKVVSLAGDQEEPCTNGDKIYCTVFVFDAERSDNNVGEIAKVMDAVNRFQGRFPIGVISHVDKALIKTRILRRKLKAAGMSDIFEVENLHSPGNETLKVKDQLTLLKLLDRCMTDGDHIAKFRGGN